MVDSVQVGVYTFWFTNSADSAGITEVCDTTKLPIFASATSLSVPQAGHYTG